MAAAVRALPQGGFASLERRDHYAQTIGQRDEYVLEPCDGGPGQHFRIEPADVDTVVAAFREFAREDPEWRAGFTWTRYELEKPSPLDHH